MSSSNNRNLCIVSSRQGAYSLSIDGIPLHSVYDPLREAEKTAAALSSQTEAVIVVENGLGYLPLQIAEQFPKADILMIVPDSSVYTVFRQQYPELMPNFPKNIRILTPFSEATLSLFLSDHPSSNTALLIPPPVEKLFPSICTRIRALVNYRRQIENTNSATLKKYGKRFSQNIKRTLPLFCAMPRTVMELKNRAIGRPTAVIGAGPTLDDHIDEVKNCRSDLILLAVDTAASVLQKHGITPDFVVTGDPQFYNAMHLFFFNAKGITLIAPLSTYFLNIRKPWREILFYASRFPGETAAAEKYHVPFLGSGGTVAATAVEAARLMNPKTVFLLGIDLGYPDGKTHAKGSFFEEKALFSGDRLNPAETQSDALLRSPLKSEAKDGNGAPILSDQRMDLYRRWFAEYAKECIRIDFRGSRIDGMTVKSRLFE